MGKITTKFPLIVDMSDAPTYGHPSNVNMLMRPGCGSRDAALARWMVRPRVQHHINTAGVQEGGGGFDHSCGVRAEMDMPCVGGEYFGGATPRAAQRHCDDCGWYYFGMAIDHHGKP